MKIFTCTYNSCGVLCSIYNYNFITNFIWLAARTVLDIHLTVLFGNVGRLLNVYILKQLSVLEVESNFSLITVRQDATVFSLLHFCRQLYVFRVLTPVIRSSYKCNYSFWYWLNGSATVCSRCWVGTDSCVSYDTHTFILFSLLHFCRQLYMFRVLTPVIRSSYKCNYSFRYWLNGSATVRSCCWVGTDSCVSYGTHESVPTQQRERTVADPFNQHQKL